jgi:uncharacterized membrane protein YfcA
MGSFSATLYWFMLPIGIGVAMCAVTSGIGGAAMFGPLFLIIFPIMGKQYVIASARGAVALAILLETFGFSSGIVGYYRRGLINYRLALRLSLFTVPGAVLSSVALIYVLSATFLKFAYSIFMLLVSFYMLMRSTNVPIVSDLFAKFVRYHDDDELMQLPSTSNHSTGHESGSPGRDTAIEMSHSNTHNPMIILEGTNINSLEANDSSKAQDAHTNTRLTDPASGGEGGQHAETCAANEGSNFNVELLRRSEIMRSLATVELQYIDYFASFLGGVMTGMLGVGTGEMTITLLSHRNYAFPVAAATSTLVVAITCWVAAFIQILTLVIKFGALSVPWGIVIYAAPGVVIGAQIAAHFQGRLDKIVIMRCVSALFVVIGIAFMYLTVHELYH